MYSLSDSLFNFNMDMPALHPSHTQKIDEGTPHPVSNIVFRLSESPRVVGDRNLDDPIPLDLHQGGQEPVHPVELWNISKALSSERPKGTDAVVDLLAAQSVSDGVGNFRGNPPQPRVFSLLTPSSSHVVSIQISQ